MFSASKNQNKRTTNKNRTNHTSCTDPEEASWVQNGLGKCSHSFAGGISKIVNPGSVCKMIFLLVPGGYVN